MHSMPPLPRAAALEAPAAAPLPRRPCSGGGPRGDGSKGSPDWPEGTPMKTMTVREALREAMAEEMRANPNVMLMGEEVGEYQGAYKIFSGPAGRIWPQTRGRYADH
ncbi:MAG: hypothetical protein U5N55_02250 [Cypionkella sp.]|nr:hypothetical protein [Cypionkella sp.]